MQKNTLMLVTIAAILTSIVSLGLFVSSFYPKTKVALAESAPVETLTHAQKVYTYALEWCESGGDTAAINPKDSDNTPSYYSWQWKPSTFKYFASLYGVIPEHAGADAFSKGMADYDTERKVLEAMVLHSNVINFRKQFPGCTRKIGLPPLSTVTNTNG